MTEIATIESTDPNGAPAGTAGVIDHSYNPYVGKSQADSNIQTISFDDFLDTINPLQHIPVVSDIYRAVTGDKISPAAHIAGNALYSGVLGVASAGISAMAALGDEIFAANNDGKGLSATLISAVFGDDDDGPKIQLASDAAQPPAQVAATPAPTPALQMAAAQTIPVQTVSAETSSPQASVAPSAPVQTPAAALAEKVAQAYATASNAPASPASKNLATAASAASSGNDPSLGMALNQSRLPFGGVMDTSMMQNALQNQALALAMASGKDNMQAEHAIRNSRFAVAPSPASPAASAPAITDPAATPSATAAPVSTAPANSASTSSAASNIASASASSLSNQTPVFGLPGPLPTGLADDRRALKGLDQYRRAAQSMPLPANMTAVNTTN